MLIHPFFPPWQQRNIHETQLQLCQNSDQHRCHSKIDLLPSLLPQDSTRSLTAVNGGITRQGQVSSNEHSRMHIDQKDEKHREEKTTSCLVHYGEICYSWRLFFVTCGLDKLQQLPDTFIKSDSPLSHLISYSCDIMSGVKCSRMRCSQAGMATGNYGRCLRRPKARGEQREAVLTDNFLKTQHIWTLSAWEWSSPQRCFENTVNVVLQQHCQNYLLSSYFFFFFQMNKSNLLPFWGHKRWKTNAAH